MAENVRVVVRCRPLNKREYDMKCSNIIQIENCTVSVQNPSDLNAPNKTFSYDSVYDTFAPTEAIYNDVCFSLIDNVLEGYNGTIFAYGQTGCGKSHTMQGSNDLSTNSSATLNSEYGIITRSFDHIFEAISVASGVRYLALISYLEIYNENIRDLLNPNESITANHPLKDIPGLGITIPTISTHTVRNTSECYHLLSMGNRHRMVGATQMNATSSRSHSIFTISLEQIRNDNSDDSLENDLNTIGGIRRGKLNLVDLAGSERQNKTGAMGERLKEATKINLSLSALGNVISALVDGRTKHIPYRDSKLTRLLQDSLGGNTKTLMISCISPADNSYDETISTLRYASRAKNISNKPKINEDPKDAKLREYQEEIMKLKKMLNESTTSPQETEINLHKDSISPVHEEANRRWLESERSKLQLEMEREMQHLKEEHIKQQREKDEQMHEIQYLRNNYEEQLKQLNSAEGTMPTSGQFEEHVNLNAAPKTNTFQFEARQRIESIKQALIGGEQANDVQLKERRQKKKMDAQRRLSALAHVLSRVQQTEDRDLLQGHYTNIQQELNAKNEHIKGYRQKVKALEREVSDLQAEFQLDRADYLESIRRLERSLKFYQQLIDKALPILRKDGKYWYPDEIIQNSIWNDDLKIWKLPELNSFKFPPATNKRISTPLNKYFADPRSMLNSPTTEIHSEAISINPNRDGNRELDSNKIKDLLSEQEDIYKRNVLNNYFRPNATRYKTSALRQQRKSFNCWKDFAQRSNRIQIPPQLHLSNSANIEDPQHEDGDGVNTHGFTDYKAPPLSSHIALDNRVLSSYMPLQANNNIALNKTWGGGGNRSMPPGSLHNNFKTNSMKELVRSNDQHSSAYFRKKTIANNLCNEEL